MSEYDDRYSDALEKDNEKVRAFFTLVNEQVPQFLDDLFDMATQIASAAGLKVKRDVIPRFGNYPQLGGCRIEIYKGRGFFSRYRQVAIVDLEHSRDRKDTRGGELFIELRVHASSFNANRLMTDRPQLMDEIRKTLEDVVIRYSIARKRN